MLIEIKVEKLLNNITEAKVIRIYPTVGARVAAGDNLFDLEANKVNIPIVAHCSGQVVSIMVKVGQTVQSGQVLATLEKQGATADTEPTYQSAAASMDNSTTNTAASGVDNIVKPKTTSPPGQTKPGGLGYFGTLMKPTKQQLSCDVAILGGGPGGYVAAILAAQKGANAVLVEKDELGGTCLNRGCIPTKALVHIAKLYSQMRSSEDLGFKASQITLDFQKVMTRKDEVVAQLRQGIAHLLKQNRITLIKGHGELINEKTILVQSTHKQTTINAKNIIMATGSVPTTLPVPGADLKQVLTTEQILQLTRLPQSLAIIGGGVIGMEYAFILANFGVKVAVIELDQDCLAGFDADICAQITRMAQNKNIKLYTNAQVQQIEVAEDGQCIVLFSQADQRKYLLSERVLLSVGRNPCLGGINATALGLELNANQRGIKVNQHLQTNIAGLYAIGDVTDTVMLAHVASYQGMVAVKNIMGQKTAMSYQAVPSAIFTDPEIAVVGITEKQARQKKLNIKVSQVPFAISGIALAHGQTQGFVKLIQDEQQKIVGAAIIGPRATDLIAGLTLAVQNKLTARQITQTIHAHPTYAEVIMEAALDLEDGAIHYFG